MATNPERSKVNERAPVNRVDERQSFVDKHVEKLPAKNLVHKLSAFCHSTPRSQILYL